MRVNTQRLSISKRRLESLIKLADRVRSSGAATGLDTASTVSLVESEELRLFIEGFDKRIQAELLALAWFGREEALPTEWHDFLIDAERAWTQATAAYLAAMPGLEKYIRHALAHVEIPDGAIEDLKADDIGSDRAP